MATKNYTARKAIVVHNIREQRENRARTATCRASEKLKHTEILDDRHDAYIALRAITSSMGGLFKRCILQLQKISACVLMRAFRENMAQSKDVFRSYHDVNPTSGYVRMWGNVRF